MNHVNFAENVIYACQDNRWLGSFSAKTHVYYASADSGFIDPVNA